MWVRLDLEPRPMSCGGNRRETEMDCWLDGNGCDRMIDEQRQQVQQFRQRRFENRGPGWRRGPGNGNGMNSGRGPVFDR